MTDAESKDEPEIVLSREEVLELIETARNSLDNLEQAAKEKEKLFNREDTMSMKEIGDELKRLSDAEEDSHGDET